MTFKQPGTHSSTPYPLVWPPLWFVSPACFHSTSSVHSPPSSSIIHKLNIGSQCISSLLSTFQDLFAPFDLFCPPLPHLISPNDIQAALHTVPRPLPLFCSPYALFHPPAFVRHLVSTHHPHHPLFTNSISSLVLVHMSLLSHVFSAHVSYLRSDYQ